MFDSLFVYLHFVCVFDCSFVYLRHRLFGCLDVWLFVCLFACLCVLLRLCDCVVG